MSEKVPFEASVVLYGVADCNGDIITKEAMDEALRKSQLPMPVLYQFNHGAPVLGFVESFEQEDERLVAKGWLDFQVAANVKTTGFSIGIAGEGDGKGGFASIHHFGLVEPTQGPYPKFGANGRLKENKYDGPALDAEGKPTEGEPEREAVSQEPSNPAAEAVGQAIRGLGDMLVEGISEMEKAKAQRDAMALKLVEAREKLAALFEADYGPWTGINNPERLKEAGLEAYEAWRLLSQPLASERVAEVQAALALAEVAEKEYIRCSFAPVWSTEATIRMMEAIHPAAQAYGKARAARAKAEGEKP